MIFIFSLSILLLITFKNWPPNSSSLVLQTQDDKFKVNFFLQAKDEVKFSKILEKLNLPQTTKDGIEFSLDAASAAKLAFVTPIKASLTLDSSRINFHGSTQRNANEEFTPLNCKIPQNTNFAVAASDLRELVKSRFTFPSEFSQWLDDNLSSSGQCLVIFGQNPDFVLILREDNVDFEKLKNLEISQEPIYFKETKDNVDFHLIKLPEKEAGISRTFTIFKTNGNIFFVSSYEAAQQLSKLKKEDTIDFPNEKSGQKITFALLFRNTDINPTTEDFYKLLFSKKTSVSEILGKISLFEFTLKDNEFSGLINMK